LTDTPAPRGLTRLEPLAVRAAITVAVTAILHALVALGVIGLTEAQQDAIVAALDTAGALFLVVWARGAVTPNAKVIATVAPADGYDVVAAGDALLNVPTGAAVNVTVRSERDSVPFPSAGSVLVNPSPSIYALDDQLDQQAPPPSPRDERDL
jgi:hypothetical protein